MDPRLVAFTALTASAAIACTAKNDGASTESSPPVASASATTNANGGAPPPIATAPVAEADAGASAAPEGMAEIPPAIMLIGSRHGVGNPEELPMHESVIAGFFFDKTEVTMDAYKACVDAGSCVAPRISHPFCNAKFPDRGNHPVNCVDWNDATAYCAFMKKRLPTESEWEYAASNGEEHRRFSWGNEDPDGHRACYDHPGSCPVASFAPGAFGLYDVSGNVWEWTSSWFAPYPDEATTGSWKVYRGGSWSRRFPKWLRNQNRNRYRVDEWSAALGIRCAMTKLPLACPDEASPRDDRCVRSRGEPRCEPGYAWNGSACSISASAANAAAPAGVIAASTPIENSAEPGAAGEGVTKTRTPKLDDDCLAHYPGTPAAYNFVGGGFWDRVPVIKSAGCVRRDTGGKWTSACCKG
jgi:formylglycine-generating enzyme required for sulfatase activity